MNANVFPIDHSRSKNGRELKDGFNELADKLSDLRRLFKCAEQHKDICPGSLTTRTDNTSGVVTLNAGTVVPAAGILVDLNFVGGARIKMLVTAVDGQAVTVSGGTGDNLPNAASGIDLSHFTTFANGFRIVGEFQPDEETPADPTVASLAYKEFDACLAAIGPAIDQAAARFKQ